MYNNRIQMYKIGYLNSAIIPFGFLLEFKLLPNNNLLKVEEPFSLDVSITLNSWYP